MGHLVWNPISHLQAFFRDLREVRKLRIKQEAEQVEAKERRKIAKAFNDRYTYRREFVPNMPLLTGTFLYGFPVRSGYAWMCPDCNKIHHPESCSSLSGLQYPACCSTAKGHRLDEGIRTE